MSIMNEQTDKHAINYVRRADRAVEDDAWIQEMLRRTAVASIATMRNDQPFINSNLFVYDEAEHAIYFHTARKGRTRDNVEQAEKVCLSVFSMGRLLPADQALVRIRLRVGRLPDLPAGRPAPSAAPEPAAEEELSDELRQRLERIDDPELREQMVRIASKLGGTKGDSGGA